MLARYNAAAATYNAAAELYSGAAKTYNTKVAARKAQILADSYSYEEKLDIPAVPCLNAAAPPPWPGQTFPGAAARLAGSALKADSMYYAFTDAEGVVSVGTGPAADAWDGRSGWM